MVRYRHYPFSGIYKESGFSQSYTLPDDCRKVKGLFFLPQFQDMLCPENKVFLAGKVSVLLNNKTDNSLHDYPILCHPDANGKMSPGDEYNFVNKVVELNTRIERGNVITVVFKDSGYMTEHIANDAATYGAYNPDLDVYLVYEDERGDWSNNEFDAKLNKFLPND